MKILTASNTAFELEKIKPKLAFLPIGATEQHSRHLPLCTDTILSDALSTELLSAVKWPGHIYLLPTLPISTSAENTGYRGTISFTPVTMRAIIRDTYQSLAMSGIKQLIVCPWHGGNFILKPVIRELNLEHGKCVVFHLNPWDHVPPEVLAIFSRGFEVHSGDFETSIMLTVAPGQVRKDRRDNPIHGLDRAWMDMWSMKTLSRGEGHAGHPAQATVKKGLILRRSVIQQAAAYLRKLLENSRKYKRY